MPELTTREFLQPCLLDRLTDDHPDQQQEGRDMRVVSLSRYRQGVLRDIEWLLNARAHVQDDEINEFAHVADSVLNYGLSDACGLSASGQMVEDIEQRILAAIRKFEPRILPGSVAVQAKTGGDGQEGVAVVFEISGDLWAQPACVVLHIKTALDLETGRADTIRGGA
jgi:type VI secretion system protein ImpF